MDNKFIVCLHAQVAYYTRTLICREQQQCASSCRYGLVECRWPSACTQETHLKQAQMLMCTKCICEQCMDMHESIYMHELLHARSQTRSPLPAPQRVTDTRVRYKYQYGPLLAT